MQKVILLTLATTTVLFSAAGVMSAETGAKTEAKATKVVTHQAKVAKVNNKAAKAATQVPAAAQQPAPVADSLSQAIMNGKVLFDARYRYEYVDQSGIANTADANTLRTRLGYETMKFHDVTTLVEVENISALGNERYNDTVNGRTAYPTVADVEGTDLNRAYIAYSGLPHTNIIFGRQGITLDNQRWVGPGAWRQNDQTFDAISVTNTSLPDTSLFYAFSDQVNRTLGYRSTAGIWGDANINLVNAAYSGLKVGKISAYSYMVDTPDSKTTSTETFGARLDGKQPVSGGVNALYALEYARQSDYGGNTANYTLDYYSVEPGINYGPFTLKGQYESIEGNGTQAVQFPLATLHAFNGWADKLTTTPANGLIDKNVGVVYVAKSDNAYLNGTKAQIFYHDYSAEHGASSHYGTEWNASIEQTINSHYTVGIQYADYQADKLFTDTVKIMPYVQVKF